MADAETLILAAIETKRMKGGSAYASGKTLIVLCDATLEPGFLIGSQIDCPSRCTLKLSG